MSPLIKQHWEWVASPLKLRNIFHDEGLLISRVEGGGLMVWFCWIRVHLFIISFLEDDIRCHEEIVSNIEEFSNKIGPRRWEIIDGD